MTGPTGSGGPLGGSGGAPGAGFDVKRDQLVRAANMVDESVGELFSLPDSAPPSPRVTTSQHRLDEGMKDILRMLSGLGQNMKQVADNIRDAEKTYGTVEQHAWHTFTQQHPEVLQTSTEFPLLGKPGEYPTREGPEAGHVPGTWPGQSPQTGEEPPHGQ